MDEQEERRVGDVIEAARALDRWIGSKSIRTMVSRPPAAADFARVVVDLREALKRYDNFDTRGGR